ncbi:GNAT family N-acetyltransferase [bacterium]|nr:GNAT family N-acetyltransferase [bacterium]
MKKKLIIFSSVAFIVGLIGYWLYVQPVHFVFNGVRPYELGDKSAVKNMFSQNTWYLLGDEIAQTYDIDFMLDYESSVQHVKKHDLRLTVLENDGSVVGFCAVYKKGLFWGQVLFVVVDEQYRGKGFAKTLLLDALSYLFDQEHCVKVTLVTRKENKAARALYEKIGFVVDQEDQYLEYILYAHAFKNKE